MRCPTPAGTYLRLRRAKPPWSSWKRSSKIDLLVTDIRLPGAVNGWDVAEKYREARRDIAVIYCSGNPSDKARQVQDSVFLSKPCRIDLLVHAAKPGPRGAPNGAQ